MASQKPTRRQFFNQVIAGAGIAGLPLIVPSSVLGRAGTVAHRTEWFLAASAWESREWAT